MTHDVSGGGWREFWLGLDRWINTWFRGRSLETISSRAGRAVHLHWWATALCWFLSWFERDHCQKAAHGAAIPHETKTPILPGRGKIDPATRRHLERLVAKKVTRPPRPSHRPPEAP